MFALVLSVSTSEPPSRSAPSTDDCAQTSFPSAGIQNVNVSTVYTINLKTMPHNHTNILFIPDNLPLVCNSSGLSSESNAVLLLPVSNKALGTEAGRCPRMLSNSL